MSWGCIFLVLKMLSYGFLDVCVGRDLGGGCRFRLGWGEKGSVGFVWVVR